MVKQSDVLKVDNHGLLIANYNQFDCSFYYNALVFYLYVCRECIDCLLLSNFEILLLFVMDVD